MPTATEFKSAQREHTSVLAALEKRTLIGIAKRLPQWVNSDHLTGLGFVALLGAGAAYWYSREHPLALLAVILLLAVNWFGDSLDGTLARVRNKQRPRYGFYVDHILDNIGMTFLMAGLALSGYIAARVAAAFLISYLLLSIEIFLATYAVGKFHLSHYGFGPTELRILLCIGNLVILLQGPTVLVAGRSFMLFNIGFSIGAAATLLILLQSTIRHTLQLYKEEPL
jgi:archaetidylinositol phosphate synthase